MGYSLTIEIPTAATDSNKILGVNKYAKHAVFEKVKKSVYLASIGKLPDRPLQNFKLSITRHGSKTLDYDNLIASFKPFIDGLKLCQIIEDDSWKYIRSIDVDQVTGKEKKLVIRVVENV